MRGTLQIDRRYPDKDDMNLYKDAWYRHRETSYQRTLSSWGEKNVKLGLGFKMPGPVTITREEFERDWELVDSRPYYEIVS